MRIFTILLAIIFSLTLAAQKKAFDIVKYNAPSGWKEELTESYIAYSKTSNGTWGQLAVYKSTVSKGDIEADLDNEWNAVVLALHAVENDEKTAAKTANGWTVISRSGNWKYNGATVGTILTVYSDGRKCISLLCNATAEGYLKEFVQMTQSVEVAPAAKNEAGNTAPAGNGNPNPSSITGLWGSYNNETSGYMNGMPMTTGGYFRKEYTFYDDGTYLYKAKDWSSIVKEIRFAYETGTYKISGNQLTLTPAKGKMELWGKAANGRTTGWGNRIKSITPKLEKVSYSIEVKYLSGMERSYLYLRSMKATERDGSQTSQHNAQHEFSYGKRNKSEEMIDTPPAVKTGFEGKK
ncbi:MAG: hypothetical protein J7527_03810 [Chitinophagaceae bacterium]|nr:hypothetical protein [Chitinophagaceae bacterium]